MSPKVAIVILNWNGREYLQRFLPSVLSCSYDNKEIFVADSASSDDSISFLQSNHPSVKIIPLQENFGFAKGYNEALRSVTCDYYLLLNSDVEVSAHFIEPVIDLMEKEKTIGAAQPKIMAYHDKTVFEYAGAAGGWIDWLGYPFARGRIFDTCEKDLGQYDTAEPIFWASGAAFFVRSGLFDGLQGFDSYFFAHMEEIDLCWRLQRSGHQIYACPESIVYHVGGGTLQKQDPRKTYLNFRNNLVMLAKNLPIIQSVWKIPLRICLDVLSGFRFLFSGRPAFFVAVVKAHLAFLGWLIIKRKQAVLPLRGTNRVLQGWFPKSIVWAYFVRGEKTFAEIVQNKK